MSNVFNKLNFDLQSRVNKKIHTNIKSYFKIYIYDDLINKGKKTHIIRYIIDYYLTPYKLYSKYGILFIDLYNYLEDCYDRNQLSMFFINVFKTDDLSKINYTFSYKEMINKILINMSYENLCIFKKNCCSYFYHKNCLF